MDAILPPHPEPTTAPHAMLSPSPPHHPTLPALASLPGAAQSLKKELLSAYLQPSRLADRQWDAAAAHGWGRDKVTEAAASYKALRECVLHDAVLLLRHQVVLLCSVCSSTLASSFFPMRDCQPNSQLLRVFWTDTFS